ncbi:MAG: response regulator [Syntrophaceae bacterium]|nr:response regulator [Syntrophaceae bacterium]
MSIILIVDDDKNFLLSLVDGLKSHDPELEIRSATNGRIALQMLDDEYVDLVITDLKMPVMDGFELLAQMSSHYPRIPVIVMTAYGTPFVETSISQVGAVRYLEKPLDFDLLLENIYNSVQTDQSAFIPGIPLISYLRLVQMEKKSCILTLRNGEQEGKMFFKKGVLMDATTDECDSENAVMEILEWEQVEIQINSKAFISDKRIQKNLDFLIMVFENRQRTKSMDETSKSSSISSYESELDGIFDVGNDDLILHNTEQEGKKTTALFDDPLITADSKISIITVEALAINQSGKANSNEAEKSEETLPSELDACHSLTSFYEETGSPGSDEIIEEQIEPETLHDDLTGLKHLLAKDYLTTSAKEDPVAVCGCFTESTDRPVAEGIRGKTQTIFLEGKETAVNVKKLNEALDTLKESAGSGLLACDIYMTRDGQSITGYNSNPTYCAMSNQITHYILNAIKEASFPPMGTTYMIDLEDDKMVIVMIVDEFQWGILIDTKKTSLGMLLNVALPRARTIFEAALTN